MLALVTFAVPAPNRRFPTRRFRSVLTLTIASSLFSVDAIAAPEPDASAPAADAAPADADADATPPDDAGEPSDPSPEEPSEEPSETDEATPDTDEAPATEGPSEDTDTEAPETEPSGSEIEAPIRPPRFDGPYVGLVLVGAANFASVLNHDTPSPLIGPGGFVQAGDAVFPWMSIGVAVGGQAAWAGRQQMFEGALLVEFGFVPARRYPLSIRTGFGFGGGALREQGIDGRSGFGGALFKGSLRYEFFPLAETKRPDRGGGWALGPELGWLGATPAGKGQPFVNTIILGLSTSFYFGS